MKTLLLLSAFLLFSITSVNSTQKDRTVYLCMGGSAYAYHIDKECKFLNKCSKEIKSVTETKAIELGRKPCKACVPSNK